MEMQDEIQLLLHLFQQNAVVTSQRAICPKSMRKVPGRFRNAVLIQEDRKNPSGLVRRVWRSFVRCDVIFWWLQTISKEFSETFPTENESPTERRISCGQWANGSLNLKVVVTQCSKCKQRNEEMVICTNADWTGQLCFALFHLKICAIMIKNHGDNLCTFCKTITVKPHCSGNPDKHHSSKYQGTKTWKNKYVKNIPQST